MCKNNGTFLKLFCNPFRLELGKTNNQPPGLTQPADLDLPAEDFADWEPPDAGGAPSEEFIPYDQAPVPKIPLSEVLGGK